jgi:[ribosomal protein S18]-alanine N-acetyltransferase
MSTTGPPTWRIRNMQAADSTLAANLHASCFAGRPERAWSRQDIAELLATPVTFGALLYDGEEPCGLSLARAPADEAEILTFGVLPTRRRGGGGRYLLQAALQEARKRGAARIFLEVAQDNAAAIGLYTSAGFIVVGRRDGYYSSPGSEPAAAIVMRLDR